MIDEELPPVSPWLQDGFHRFILPMLRRQFHAIAIERECLDQIPSSNDGPLIVYANHASWWDPLVSHFLNRALFAPRQFYAPIDAAALQKYRVFGKLGFYGVEMDSKAGASAFLKRSRAILSTSGSAIWMTPEGQFTDVRNRDVPLMPGLSHLCSKLDEGFVVPLALEYVFWDERLPVCLARTGQAFHLAESAERSKQSWNELLTERLHETQDKLAERSIARSSDPFESLITGRQGGGFVYDSFRRAKSAITGKRFESRHGEQFK